jgi:hypothetical protein
MCGIILLMPSFIRAYAQQGEYTLDYEETFDSGRAQDWEFIPQNDEFNAWRVVENRLEGYGVARANYLKKSWGDALVGFRFYPQAVDSLLIANVRISEKGLYSLAMQKGDQNILYVYLRRQIAGVDPNPILVQEGKTEYNPKLEYRRIQMGEGIQVFLNPIRAAGVPVEAPPPVITFEDAEPLPPGGIGFQVEGTNPVWVDDVQVQIPSQAPAEVIIGGQVLEGRPENREKPLPGAHITLFVSNNPFPGQGEPVEHDQR